MTLNDSERKGSNLTSSNQFRLEIERKYSISQDEYLQLKSKLTELAFVFIHRSFMHDTFLPTIDIGDMSRIRVETIHDTTTTILTRKTWTTVDGMRERRETADEILGTNTKELLLELGTRLNGRELLSFHKVRDEYEKKEGVLNVTVTLDNAEGLGEYNGYYLEIEVLVPVDGDVGPARRYIEDLAFTLFGETRQFVELSYMEMLMRTAVP